MDADPIFVGEGDIDAARDLVNPKFPRVIRVHDRLPGVSG
jgi:hypothetical protein